MLNGRPRYFYSFLLVLCYLPSLPTVANGAVQGPAEFGKLANGTSVEYFTLTNDKGMSAKVMTLGAIILELNVPDKTGKAENIVVGFDNLKAYEKGSVNGAVLGRFANRIANARFTLDGKEYTLTGNSHGGKKGFHTKLWKAEPLATKNAVRFGYSSADGEEGYPGNLKATVTYTLTNDNELRIDYEATSDKTTTVNLSNHSYFNLGGPKSKSILDEILELPSDTYTVFDKALIPTGEIASVAGTPFDFRKAKRIGDGIDELKKSGIRNNYDQNYVLRGKTGELDVAAKISDPASGRTMTVTSDQVGMQVYTGSGNAICFETQHHPNSINIPQFPTTVLRPGATFRTSTVFAFSAK